MLKLGAEKNAFNRFRQTPLHIAAQRRCVKHFKNLKGFARTFDIFGNQPVHYACAAGGDLQGDERLEIEFFADDLEEDNESGWTALHIACFFNRIELVKVLLSQFKVDVNAQIKVSGKTPFMIACEKGFKDMCLHLLKQPSFEVEKCDNTCGTALEWACEFEETKVFEELLKKESLLLFSEKKKVALLHMLCQRNNADFQRLFFTYWKQIDNVNDKGDTVLHIACSRGYEDVVRVLLKDGRTYEALGGSKRNYANDTAVSCASKKGFFKIHHLLVKK